VVDDEEGKVVRAKDPREDCDEDVWLDTDVRACRLLRDGAGWGGGRAMFDIIRF
jgi:hypothetical protein